MTCFDLTASARRPGPARTTTDYSTVDEGFALPAAPGAAQRPATMLLQCTVSSAPFTKLQLCTVYFAPPFMLSSAMIPAGTAAARLRGAYTKCSSADSRNPPFVRVVEAEFSEKNRA